MRESTQKANTKFSPMQNVTSSFLLYLTARTLAPVCFAAAIILFFVGMFFNWGLVATLCWSFGLVLFGMLSYVIFRAFGDLLVSISDLHSLLEERLHGPVHPDDESA